MTPRLTLVVYTFRRDPRSLEIVRLVRENRVMTVHEVAVRLGLPYGSVWYKVEKLERLGILRTEKGPQHSRLVSVNPMARRVVERAIQELSAPKRRK